MKAISLSALLLAAFCVPAPILQSAAQKLAPERVTLRVLKVFAAQDGEHRFRAYLVEYKGQEVIVEDNLVKTSYRTDDDITILVMRHSHPDPTVAHGLLKLSVVPPRFR